MSYEFSVLKDIPVYSRCGYLATSVPKNPWPLSHFEGNYHGLAISVVLHFPYFHIRMVWSNLPFGSGPRPLLVPRLFSGIETRSECWQGLLSVLTVWVDEFQGWNLCLGLRYILVQIQHFCANQCSASSLWHLLMYTHLTIKFSAHEVKHVFPCLWSPLLTNTSSQLLLFLISTAFALHVEW